jgi:hypothetical protein
MAPPGVSIWGVVPSDEEFRAKAIAIVDETGKDQRAAIRLIDDFGTDIGWKMNQAIVDLGRQAGVGPEVKTASLLLHPLGPEDPKSMSFEKGGGPDVSLPGPPGRYVALGVISLNVARPQSGFSPTS